VCALSFDNLDVRNYVAGIMDRSSLAAVAKSAPVSKQEVSGDFMGGEGI